MLRSKESEITELFVGIGLKWFSNSLSQVYLPFSSFNSILFDLSHRHGFGIGLIKAPMLFPYHSFTWQSSHTIPIAHIISRHGNGIDFLQSLYQFPIDKTIERQYMASYRFDMVGHVPYQNHNEIHMWPIDYFISYVPIYGPYMSNVTQFSKGYFYI